MTYRLRYTDGRLFGDIWGTGARGRAMRLAGELGLVVTLVAFGVEGAAE